MLYQEVVKCFSIQLYLSECKGLECKHLHMCRLIKRPDGSDWELGSGAFGRVVLGLRGGVQVMSCHS